MKEIDKAITIFWFRRDLRINDNHGFYEALKSSENVLPLFIFGSWVKPVDRYISIYPEPLDMQRIASTDLQSIAFSKGFFNLSPFNLSSVFIIIKDSIFFRQQK